MPKKNRADNLSFGIFPFPLRSSAPAASRRLLIKNATSIYYSMNPDTTDCTGFIVSITPLFRSVNKHGEML